jgi:hypothetical protein
LWPCLLDGLIGFCQLSEQFILSRVFPCHLTFLPFASDAPVVAAKLAHFCSLATLAFAERPDLLAFFLSSDVFALLGRLLRESADRATLERSLLFLGNALQFSEAFLQTCLASGLLQAVADFQHRDRILMKRKYWLLSLCCAHGVELTIERVYGDLVAFHRCGNSYFAAKCLKCLAKASAFISTLLTPALSDLLVEVFTDNHAPEVHRRGLKFMAVALQQNPEWFEGLRQSAIAVLVAGMVANPRNRASAECFRFFTVWCGLADEGGARELLECLISGVDFSECNFAVKSGFLALLDAVALSFPSLAQDISACEPITELANLMTESLD